MVSAAFDFALALVCFLGARGATRWGNDFLHAGFVWVASAAFAGGWRLGGYAPVAPLHDWLTEVSRGPGTLLLALGVVSAMWGPWSTARWWVVPFSVAGSAAVHALMGSSLLAPVALAMGIMLLAALLVLAGDSLRRGRPVAALAAATAVGLFLFMAFGMGRVSLPEGSPLARVDIVHLLLMGAYGSIWLAVSNGQPR
jgi:hypothetical protein